MNIRENIEGIICDVDGVLVDSEQIVAAAEKEMFRRRHGIEFTDEDFRKYVGIGEDNFLLKIGEIYDLDVTLPDDKIHTYEIYLEMIKGQLKPVPGALEFIDRCRAEKIPLAAATSGDRIKLEGSFGELGISRDAFSAVVTGNDVTRHKPDPEIFIKASSAMGLDPELCVVVEDSLSGAKAAKAIDAGCLGITTSFTAQELLDAGADRTAADMKEGCVLLFE